MQKIRKIIEAFRQVRFGALFGKLLKPNPKWSKAEDLVWKCIWAALLIGAWFFIHIPFIANPVKTWAGFRHLWTVDGFGIAAVSSIQLYIITMVLGVLAAGLLTVLAIPPLVRPPIYWLQVLRFMPIVGLNLFLLIFLGSGYTLTFVLMVFFQTIMLLPMFLETKDSVEEARFNYSRTIYKSEWKVCREEILFGRAVQFFRNNKINQPVGWVMLFVAESFDMSGGGIGALMARKMKNPDLAQVEAILLFCALVGFLLYWVCDKGEIVLFPNVPRKAGRK